MRAEDVISLLKEARVGEALSAIDEVKDKKEMARKLTEFAAALNYLRGRDDLTEVLLKKSLFLDREHAPTYYNLGVLRSSPKQLIEDEGNLGKAELAYNLALKHDPGFHEARYNLALLYYFKGDHEEAKKEYAQIVEAVGDDERFRELGMLLQQEK